MRWAFTPISLRPTRDMERMSSRLPGSCGVIRMTISSGEAEEQAGVCGFEAALLRLDGDELPAHSPCHRCRLGTEGGGGQWREVGDKIGIRLLLGRCHGRACVSQPIGGGGTRRCERDKGGGLRRIRRDIMDRRDTPRLRVVGEGHPGTDDAEQQSYVCVSSAGALVAHPASDSREQTHHEGRQARDRRPLHEGEQREADVPHPEPIAERGQEDPARADKRQSQSSHGSDSHGTVHKALRS
jgi:hypothetical protein